MESKQLYLNQRVIEEIKKSENALWFVRLMKYFLDYSNWFNCHYQFKYLPIPKDACPEAVSNPLFVASFSSFVFVSIKGHTAQHLRCCTKLHIFQPPWWSLTHSKPSVCSALKHCIRVLIARCALCSWVIHRSSFLNSLILSSPRIPL